MVCGCKYKRIVVKQTHSNFGTFDMFYFNIVEILRNYFTRELLLDNLSSEAALHFKVS